MVVNALAIGRKFNNFFLQHFADIHVLHSLVFNTDNISNIKTLEKKRNSHKQMEIHEFIADDEQIYFKC